MSEVADAAARLMQDVVESSADARHEAAMNGAPAWRALLEKGLRVRSTRDRVTRPLPDRSWLWHGYILDLQLVLLHGDGGLYKSLLSAALAAVYTQPMGGWLLGQPVRPGRAAFVDAENDDHDIDDRLRRLGVSADNDRLAYHGIEEGLLGRAQESGVLLELLGGIITDQRASLLVIDSLASAWGLKEDDQALVQTLLDTLNQARRLYACTILLVHHDRRSGGFRGFSNLHNAVQSRLHLIPASDRQDDDQPVREIALRHAKQRSGAKQRRCVFTVAWDAHRVELVPTSDAMRTVEKVVQHVMMCGKLVPAAELRDRFDLGKNFLSQNAEVLHAAGIERDREDEPRQSRGWQPRTVPDSVPAGTPSQRDRSTTLLPGRSLDIPEDPEEGATIQDSAVPPTPPLRGEVEHPPGERLAPDEDVRRP